MKKSKQALVPLLNGETTRGGTPLNEIVHSANRNFELNKKTGKRIIQNGVVTIETTNDLLQFISNDAVSLLLNFVRISLTQTAPPVQLTDEDRRKNGYIDEALWYDLKDYAHTCGYDVYNEDKKTAKSELDNFRKARDKAVKELKSLYISWTGTGKAKGDYANKNLIVESGRLHGKQYAVVHADILRALKQLDFITSLPKSLFCIGTGRRQVKLLHFMATHYNINANKQNGTHNILKITSLLNYTDLPTIEHLEATNNRNYEGRILTPLYTYLNQFVEDGTLLLWEPCLSKKQFATEDTDIADMSAKQTIEEAYIHFEFATNIYPTIEAYEDANKDMYEHIDE